MNLDYKFHIEPRDLLFLRDGRPMEASDAGLGANWPRPDQIWNAFINAFHARWPEPMEWEGYRHKFKEKVDNNSESSFRFGALKSAGPFPVDQSDNEIYFPCPLDLSSGDGDVLQQMTLGDKGLVNLPSPLDKVFHSAALGKNELPSWISSKDYANYLGFKPFKPEKVELYDTERNIGIGIAPETGTTIDGKFYQAEYLRFRGSVRMAVQTSCVLKGSKDVFEEIAKEENIPLVLGGQQGVALLSSAKHDFRLPLSVLEGLGGGRQLLRWTLLSPAVYPAIEEDSGKKIKRHPGGWLPNWIDAEDGKVLLPRKPVERQSGESREEWRFRVRDAEKSSAKLVAARIGKPVYFSGWDLQTGPKPTYLAVPAGAVYVFETADTADAQDLCNALSWNGGEGDQIRNRRSTLFGEKGFGLGVCSALKGGIAGY